MYKGPFQLKSLYDTMTIRLSLILDSWLYATSSILCHACFAVKEMTFSWCRELLWCEDFFSVDKNSNSTAVSMQYLPLDFLFQLVSTWVLTLKLKHAFVLQLLSTYCLYWSIYKRKWSSDSTAFLSQLTWKYH